MTVIFSSSRAHCPFILPSPMNYECWLNQKPEGDNRAKFCHLHFRQCALPSLDFQISPFPLAAKETQEYFGGGEKEILIANHDNDSKPCRHISLLNYVSSQAQQTPTVLTYANI